MPVTKSFKKKLRALRKAVIVGATDGWDLGNPNETLNVGLCFDPDAGPFGIDLNETYDRVVTVSAAAHQLAKAITGKKL